MSSIKKIITITFTKNNEIVPNIKSIITKIITNVLPQFFPLNSALAIVNCIIATTPKTIAMNPPKIEKPLDTYGPVRLADSIPVVAATSIIPIPPKIYRIPRTVIPVGLFIFAI